MEMDSLLGTMRMQMKFNVERENNNIAMWELVNYKVIGFCVILLLSMFFLTYLSGEYVKNYFRNKKML